MNAHERRRKRLLRAIERYQEKLDRLDPAKYEWETDFRKVRTFYLHKVAGLRRKLLEGREEP